MKDLNQRAFGGLLSLLITLAALLFLSAWTVYYWQAWVFLGVFSASVFAITIYLMRKDPQLLERRIHSSPGAEKERSQKVIRSLLTIAFIGVVVFPAIDHRFTWSRLAPYVCAIGDMFVALGLLIIFFVFKENTFTSGIIQVETGQQIISTGPYRMCAPSDVHRSCCHALRRASRAWLDLGIAHNYSDYACDRVETS